MRPATLAMLAVAALLLAPAAASASDRSAARAGAAWLLRAVPAGSGDGQAADTLVAARAAGALPRAAAGSRAAALRRRAGSYARTPGATAKVVLGLQAATGRGRCAGRTDLVRRIQRAARGGRYGRTVFDQALSMLALRATGQRVPASAVRFLARVRGGGGWSVTLSRALRDDVTSTGMAIVALRAAGVARGNRTLRSARAWMRRQRTPSGGYALGRRDRTEANSTAIAIMAERAMGSGDRRAARALRTLQRGGGAFQFTRTDAGSRVIASTDAVLALSGATLPVRRATRPIGGC